MLNPCLASKPSPSQEKRYQVQLGTLRIYVPSVPICPQACSDPLEASTASTEICPKAIQTNVAQVPPERRPTTHPFHNHLGQFGFCPTIVRISPQLFSSLSGLIGSVSNPVGHPLQNRASPHKSLSHRHPSNNQSFPNPSGRIRIFIDPGPFFAEFDL